MILIAKMFPLRVHIPCNDIDMILIAKMYPLRVHMPGNDIDS